MSEWRARQLLRERADKAVDAALAEARTFTPNSEWTPNAFMDLQPEAQCTVCEYPALAHWFDAETGLTCPAAISRLMTTRKKTPPLISAAERLQRQEEFYDEANTDEAGNRSLFYEEQKPPSKPKKSRRTYSTQEFTEQQRARDVETRKLERAFTPRPLTDLEKREQDTLPRPKRRYDDDY